MFLCLFLSALKCVSQSQYFDHYYPENPQYKALKVKSVTEIYRYSQNMILEFDTLGRQISWKYAGSDGKTCFNYRRSGYTLFRSHFYQKNDTSNGVYEIDQFVYNEKGKILSYLNCKKNYGSDIDLTECRMQKFIYENEVLQSRLTYRPFEHPQALSETIRPEISDSILEEVVDYKFDQRGNLISAIDMLGDVERRSIDSFFYDKKGRLSKHINKQAAGFVGELIGYDISRIEIFEYGVNMMRKIETLTYIDIEPRKGDTIVNEYHYDQNGLCTQWVLNASTTKYSYTYY